MPTDPDLAGRELPGSLELPEPWATSRLREPDLELPEPAQAPPGVRLPFTPARVVGAHARSAVGMAELPFNLPVEVKAEVRIMP